MVPSDAENPTLFKFFKLFLLLFFSYMSVQAFALHSSDGRWLQQVSQQWLPARAPQGRKGGWCWCSTGKVQPVWLQSTVCRRQGKGTQQRRPGKFASNSAPCPCGRPGFSLGSECELSGQVHRLFRNTFCSKLGAIQNLKIFGLESKFE